MAKFNFVWSTVPVALAVPSSADKHQASGVDEVSQVEDEVDRGEHSHRHRLIPHTQPKACIAVGRPLLLSSMLRVKVEDGPDDGCGQIKDHSQQGVGWQEASEREGEVARQLSNAQQDDAGRQDEADAVDGHAVLQRIVAVVQHGIGDKNKDDASQKGLADFQESGSCGHVAGYLAGTRLADAHLGHVGDGGQAGEDGWHYAEVPHFTGPVGVFEVVKREDDGGGQTQKSGVAGKRDWEVLPWNEGSALEAKQLHKQDEQRAGEAEGPAEDAPVSCSVCNSATVYGHGEGHARESQGCEPCP